MLVVRNGTQPRVHHEARIAPSAHVVGDVRIGRGSYIDYNVTIASAGPPVEIGERVVVLSGSVIRSVGGRSRPPFPVAIGDLCLISPLCALAGCRIGTNCYLATNVVVLQGAVIGDHTRVGVGAIVHARTELPPRSRVGMRDVAVPTRDGFLSTAVIDAARRQVAAADFFEVAFGSSETDQALLHEQVIEKLLEEVHCWDDSPVFDPPPANGG
jgi:carbonic anhydrase/acetyltransferase-like protein (isoleucine patch superfamily)